MLLPIKQDYLTKNMLQNVSTRIWNIINANNQLVTNSSNSVTVYFYFFYSKLVKQILN